MNADPLAKLRDIHLPPPVSWWPPAPGWWILASLIVVVLTAALAWWLRRRWRNRYRRRALVELATLHARYRDQPANYLAEVNVLLKRSALRAYPQQAVAALNGEAWLRFLDAQTGTESFRRGPGRLLLEQAYRPDPQGDIDALHRCAKHWLERHRC